MSDESRRDLAYSLNGKVIVITAERAPVTACTCHWLTVSSPFSCSSLSYLQHIYAVVAHLIVFFFIYFVIRQ